jgi:hypothetical protein
MAPTVWGDARRPKHSFDWKLYKELHPITSGVPPTRQQARTHPKSINRDLDSAVVTALPYNMGNNVA